VQQLKPDWSEEKCEQFLMSVCGKLQDAAIMAGWNALDALLLMKEEADMKGGNR
jgi:hypothetical protein